MELSFLSLEELCRRHPAASKAFRPPAGAFPFVFVATEKEVVVGNVGNHLMLALAAWPPFPVDVTSYLIQAAHRRTRSDVVGMVRPRIKAGGSLDAQGIVFSYECPSLDIRFDQHGTDLGSTYFNDLRATLYDFFNQRRCAQPPA